MPDNENRPAGNGAESTTASGANHYIAGLRRRRAATYRLPALDCGHADPTCRHDTPTSGYAQAAAHLLQLGLTPAPNLPALRNMWRAGGDNQRLAIQIAQRWEAA